MHFKFSPTPVNSARPHRAARIGVAIAAALLALVLTAAPAHAQQQETSVACDENNDPLAMMYGDSTTGCAISPAAGDTDRFFFTGEAGDIARLRLVTLTNNLDPFVDVRDDMNQSIATFNCTAGTTTRCSTGTSFLLPRDGTYLVIVSEIGADNTGSYLLHLERILPPPASVPLAYDAPLSDTIGPSTDTDFFQFEAEAGTSLRLNALGLVNNLDLRFQLYDPDGNLALNGTADGAGCNAGTTTRCSFAVNFVPALSGTYSLQVYDDDAFNGGDYRISLWCLFGDCPNSPVPDADGTRLLYVPALDDTLEQATDSDQFIFNATVGTTVILRGITLSNNLDVRLQVRDPNGELIANGIGDGAGCNAGTTTRCGFGFTFEPALSGTYSVLVFDDDLFNGGGYRLTLFCSLGACDGDADGLPDDDRQPMSYGVSITPNAISPSTDGDFYEFMGTAGDEIRITMTTQSNNLDPRIQIRDPGGELIVNGIADGGGCDSGSTTTCSFSKTLLPVQTGVYSMSVFDNDGFNSGEYDITLVCVFGTGVGFTCDDLAAPPACADNCSSRPNVDQRDSNGDGFGNACDADLNDDGIVNAVDLGLLRKVFLTGDDDADFNGDGNVNVVDLGIMRLLFLAPVGPSCTAPNWP